MINIYSAHPTSSFTMYPEDPITEITGGVFELQLTQDYDQSTYRVENLNRLNTTVASNKSHVIILQAYSSSVANIPQYDGQYTAELYYGTETRSKWGDTHYTFGELHRVWSDVVAFSGSVVSTDRAYVHGTNLQDITTYTGTNQTGAYTTYNS